MSVSNFPTAPREPLVDKNGYITRAWFLFLTGLFNGVQDVPGFASNTGFLHVTNGLFDPVARPVDLSDADATGTLAAARAPALMGDVHTTAGSLTTTLATVNSNVGSFTNTNITVNAKGLITAAASGTITSPVTSVSAADTSVTVTPTTGAVTVALPVSGAVAGSYTNINATVNNRGIITAVANGSGGAGVFTVATLPTPTSGALAFANDANTTLVLGLGSVVAGGGGNFVPVYADGANWIIG